MIKPVDTIQKIKEGSRVTIAAIGDSLTYGWLVNKGYLDFLGEMLKDGYPDSKINFINKGVPGDTASGGLIRLENDVLLYKPDMIFIQFALNDAFTGYSPSEYRKNIEEIIDRINKAGKIDIVLITSVFLGYSIGEDVSNVFYNVLDTIAIKKKIPIVKVHEYWEKHIKNESHFMSLVQDDRLHPNEDGYRLMAEAIMEMFK